MSARKKKVAPVLMLRTCEADGGWHGGFKWPLTVGAEVSCPDWSPVAGCGNGLHGLINGEGDWSLVGMEPGRKMLVFEAVGAVVKLSGGTKAKCEKAIVRWVGEAKDWPQALGFIWATNNAKPEASATGDYGHASATGDYGHASATGDCGIGVALGKSYDKTTNARAKASKSGAIVLVDWSGKRPRIVVGYPGEGGIKADTWYRVEGGKLVECAS